MNKTSPKKYLAEFLKISPLSHALWRSVEALSFEEVDYKKPILDLGCGWGEFAGVVFNQMEMGIDINEKEIKRALKGNRYKKVLWADARKLPFKSSSYSSVVSVSVLEHIPQSELVLAEIHRVLKKGGLFVFSVPTIKLYDDLLVPQLLQKIGLRSLGKKYFQLHCRIFKHVGLKTPLWWDKQLKAAGFEIVTKRGTISPTVVKLHETFLITAFPSQLWKLFFKRRLIMSVGLRSKFLPFLLGKYMVKDSTSLANMFYVVKKL